MKKKAILFFAFITAIVLLSGCAQPAANRNPNGGNIVDSSKIVETGDTIKVEYKGTFPASGEEFDSSEKLGEALEFVAGAGQMIKGFDLAVIGMRLGEEKTITLSPEDAYGYVDEKRIVEIKKENIADFENLEIGMSVNSPQAGVGVIKEIKENSAIVDFNNPLAGKTLVFWIKIAEIQKAG